MSFFSPFGGDAKSSKMRHRDPALTCHLPFRGDHPDHHSGRGYGGLGTRARMYSRVPLHFCCSRRHKMSTSQLGRNN